MTFEFDKLDEAQLPGLRELVRGPVVQLQATRAIDRAAGIALIDLGKELRTREADPLAHFNLLGHDWVLALRARISYRSEAGRNTVVVEVVAVDPAPGHPFDDASLRAMLAEAMTAYWSGLHRRPMRVDLRLPQA